MAFSVLSSNLLLIKELVRNLLTSPKPRDGLGHMNHSESETFNDDGLAGWGVWWADPPRAVAASNVAPNTQVLPSPVPHWLSTVGCTIFPEVTCLIISFFLPSQLTSAVFKEDLLASLPLPPTSCLLGTLQVAELCLLCKSLGRFGARAQAVGGVLSLESPSPNPKFKESRPQLYLKNPGLNFVLKMDHFK